MDVCSCSLNTEIILNEIFKILMLLFLKVSFNIIFKYNSIVLGFQNVPVQCCQWLGIRVTDKL